MGNVIAVAGFICVVVLFGMLENYGDEQRKRECAIASASKEIPKCDYDPNYHGED